MSITRFSPEDCEVRLDARRVYGDRDKLIAHEVAYCDYFHAIVTHDPLPSSEPFTAHETAAIVDAAISCAERAGVVVYNARYVSYIGWLAYQQE